MADELRGLRQNRQITGRDIVAAVQELYPSFDKTLLSKAERGDKYGIALRRDAVDAVIERYTPGALEAHKRRRAGGHRLTCRISCRLENGEFGLLQQLIRDAGHKTTQGWLSDLVKQQIKMYSQGTKGESENDQETA